MVARTKRDGPRYRLVEVQMWARGSFTRLSPLKPSGQALWLYLLTNPDTTSVPGLYRSGEAQMAEALGWKLPAFRKHWKEIEAEGMARADWRRRVVWLPGALERNTPTAPNTVTSWRGRWDEIPDCPLKHEAWQVLRAHFDGRKGSFQTAFAEACAEPQLKPSDMPCAMPCDMASPVDGRKVCDNQDPGSRSQEPGGPPPEVPPRPSASPEASAAPCPPRRPAATASSRRPGAGRDGDQGPPGLEATRDRLRHALPNTAGQQRNGEDTTLHGGERYLWRIGKIDAALRDQISGDLGPRPAPGRLLEAVAAGEFERIAAGTDRAFSTGSIRNEEAYIRSALARGWNSVLPKLEDAAQTLRAERRKAGGAS